MVGIFELGDTNFRGTGDKVNLHWEFGGAGHGKNYQGLSFWAMTIYEKNSAPAPLPEISTNSFFEADPLIDWNELLSRVESGEIRRFQGTAVYPRFYFYQTGEHGADPLFRNKPYSRLTLRVMGTGSAADVMIPMREVPKGLTHTYPFLL